MRFFDTYQRGFLHALQEICIHCNHVVFVVRPLFDRDFLRSSTIVYQQAMGVFTLTGNTGYLAPVLVHATHNHCHVIIGAVKGERSAFCTDGSWCCMYRFDPFLMIIYQSWKQYLSMWESRLQWMGQMNGSMGNEQCYVLDIDFRLLAA